METRKLIDSLNVAALFRSDNIKADKPQSNLSRKQSSTKVMKPWLNELLEKDALAWKSNNRILYCWIYPHARAPVGQTQWLRALQKKIGPKCIYLVDPSRKSYASALGITVTGSGSDDLVFQQFKSTTFLSDPESTVLVDNVEPQSIVSGNKLISRLTANDVKARVWIQGRNSEPLYFLPVIRTLAEDKSMPLCNFYSLSAKDNRWRPLLSAGNKLSFWHGLFYQKCDSHGNRSILGRRFNYADPGNGSDDTSKMVDYAMVQLPFLLNDTIGQEFYPPSTQKLLKELKEHFTDPTSNGANNGVSIAKQCISPEALDLYRSFVGSLGNTQLLPNVSANHLKRLVMSFDHLIVSNFVSDPIVSSTCLLELLSAAGQCNREEENPNLTTEPEPEDMISIYSGTKLPSNASIITMRYPSISLQVIYLDLSAIQVIPSSDSSSLEEEDFLDALIAGSKMTIRAIYNQTVWDWHESRNSDSAVNCFAILKVPSNIISSNSYSSNSFHVQRLQ